jgi:multidrug efflux pump subunit AcrB
MGIIMMVGISVSYGNILIDRINTLITGGENMNSAIINGSLDRFRPILMTAATTVFGLLPTAIGFGNADANAPLAIAVIGGTIAAALLSLYIVPVLYSLISKNKIYEK